MAKTVERVKFNTPKIPKVLNVAAYARVSSGKDAMLHSLEAQVRYYSEYIQSHHDWHFCGVYADEAMTGTKSNRDNFQLFLQKCREGELDLILCKSISRFARNTITLLETVRELKNLGIGVIFEEQNINSLSSDGELMLTILASFAQEESLSVSENQKWRIRSDFQQGKVCSMRMLGYRRTKNGSLEIIPEEAVIVRRIFSDYLTGMGKLKIANTLNEEHILTINGCTWTTEDIRRILQNEKYAGNMLLQKSYRENHSTSKYRRIIWQCNGKFKYETHCSTPHFYEDEIKERFIIAFNQFFQNKELVLEACKMAIAQLSNTDSIEEKVNILTEELEMILMEKQDYVLNHIRDEINHFEFDRKCAEFDERYNEKAKAYNRLQEKLVQRQSRAEFLQKFYSRVKAITDAIDFFDAALWRALIEKATVHHDGRIIFKFLDGTEIEA